MAADAEITLEARVRDFISARVAKMQGNLDKFSARARQAMSKVKGAFNDAKSGVVDFFKRFGPAALASAALFAALRKLGDALDFVREKSMDFEKTLSNVKAILLPTRNQMSALSNEAKRLGATTAFSASEAGQAFVEMGKLGFTTNEILKSTGDILNVAALSGKGMAESAEVVIKTLNQFNLGAEDASHLTDVMAKSFNTTALDMDKFRESMKFVGTSARQVGLSIEETTAFLGVMADNGLEASTAGTSLNQLLIQLVNTGSKANKVLKQLGAENGTVSEKMIALRDSGIDVGQVFEFLDVRAGRAANVLFENIGRANELKKSFTDADGAAKRMADTMIDNLAGDMKILESVSESLAITIGEAFNESKRERIQAYSEFVAVANETTMLFSGGIGTVSELLNAFIVGPLEAVTTGIKIFNNTLLNLDTTWMGVVSMSKTFKLAFQEVANLFGAGFDTDKTRADIEELNAVIAKRMEENKNNIKDSMEESKDAVKKQVQEMLDEMFKLEKETKDKFKAPFLPLPLLLDPNPQFGPDRPLFKEQVEMAKAAEAIRKKQEQTEKEAKRIQEQADKKAHQEKMKMLKAEAQLRNEQFSLAMASLGVAQALTQNNKDLIPILNTIKTIELAIATARQIANATSPFGMATAGLGGLGGLIGLLAGFSSGGVVPGSPGEPRLVVAHGGEKITADSPAQNNFNTTINYSPSTTLSGNSGSSDKMIMDIIERHPEKLASILEDVQRRRFGK